MPVKTIKRGGKFRIIETSTGKIAKNRGGTALDGGGHASQGKADRQSRAINANI